MRVCAASFINPYLPEPHERELGGEPVRELFAEVFADWACPPSGHAISWSDWYAHAKLWPLPTMAGWFLEPDGSSRALPGFLTAEQRVRAEHAIAEAVWIRREARRRGLD